MRERLGQVDGGVIAPFPSKPKWARWPRYLRLRREALRREAEHWHALGIRLGGFMVSLRKESEETMFPIRAGHDCGHRSVRRGGGRRAGRSTSLVRSERKSTPMFGAGAGKPT